MFPQKSYFGNSAAGTVNYPESFYDNIYTQQENAKVSKVREHTKTALKFVVFVVMKNIESLKLNPVLKIRSFFQLFTLAGPFKTILKG